MNMSSTQANSAWPVIYEHRMYTCLLFCCCLRCASRLSLPSLLIIPGVWNSLPRTVLETTSLSIFRFRTQTFLYIQVLDSTCKHDLPPAPLKSGPFGAVEILFQMYVGVCLCCKTSQPLNVSCLQWTESRRCWSVCSQAWCTHATCSLQQDHCKTALRSWHSSVHCTYLMLTCTQPF